MHSRFRGIFPPLPTTFDSRSGDVDAGAISGNVSRLMKTGLAGVLALGSNGEASLLDEDEAERVVGAAREKTPANKTLLVGVGRESTRATIAACRRAAALGGDAVLVRPPFYYRSQMTPDALLAHFRAVADASPLPVLLYNLPGPTGVVLTVPLVAQLADHPNIVGLKETSPELERLSQFAALASGRLAILSGWAPVIYPALVAGGCGGILAVANVLPDECVELFDHAMAGRHAEALALQRRITVLAQLVSSVHGIAGLKVAMESRGFRGGPVRAPLLPLGDRARADVIAALEPFKR
jgi:4-hydroxy-2-oxoglutarate aldolase